MKFLKDEPEMQAFAAVVIFTILMLIACVVAAYNDKF